MDVQILFFVAILALIASYTSLTANRQVHRVLYGFFAAILFLSLAAILNIEGYRLMTSVNPTTGVFNFTSYNTANSLSAMLLSYGFFAVCIVFFISILSEFLNWKGNT